MAKCIMVQGTGSSVGKSRIVTGLCRIFKQDGFKVAPFKSQNMALNSFITCDGLEIGKAQATQAEACGIEASAYMNPVLLKPCSNKNSQVIVMGKSYGNLSALDYHEFKPKLLQIVKEAYEKLASENDIIVIEGAGSPAEINLRDRDIVNMGLAELIGAPVVLVGDIDRGGVFASLAGTMLLLSETERALVKGVIINKFRGDLNLLLPGLEMLEDIIKVPVLGVVPYSETYVDEEDSPQSEYLRLKSKISTDHDLTNDVNVKVLTLPHITNFTDLVPLSEAPGINISYVKIGSAIGDADVLVIPGTSNVSSDLESIKVQGWFDEIHRLTKSGKVILGICEGYQMLGKTIEDPDANMSISGLGLIDIKTRIKKRNKPTHVIGSVVNNLPGPASLLNGTLIKGYKMHTCSIVSSENINYFIKTTKEPDKTSEMFDGCVNANGKIIGTCINGIFEESEFLSRFVNYLKCAADKVSENNIGTYTDFKKFKEMQYEKWANELRESINISSLYKIMELYQ